MEAADCAAVHEEMLMSRMAAAAGREEQDAGFAGLDFFEGFISEEEYAARRGVSVRTCQRDRQLRQSPPYVVIGRRVFYRIEAVRKWLIAREQAADRRPSALRARGRR
jgi:hypothetical protein